MSSPPVQLYAELLANIRQVSVSASFEIPVDAAKTIAVVLPDGETLQIQRDGHMLATMTLPGRVAIVAGQARSLPMQGPSLASGTVTWRLPVATSAAPRGQGRNALNNNGNDDNGDDDSLAPWSAPALPAKARVACRSCDTELVAASTIEVWKDLPSDNWAEMMEFWHCHKPDTKKTEAGTAGDKKEDGRLADRGYGANSVISAEKGVGFVDLATLLFSEDDCRDLLFSISTVDKSLLDREKLLSSAPADLRGLHVYCSSCRAQVGYLTLQRNRSVRLFKWQVSVAGADLSAPSVADCVAAMLIATLQRTGSSKSFLLPIYELETPNRSGTREEEPQARTLQVWLLNSNINYAAWPAEAPSGPAIKLLYRSVSRKEADTTLERLNSDVQEVNLPRETIADVERLLEASNRLLPPQDRLFQDWRIGLLKRWRGSE